MRVWELRDHGHHEMSDYRGMHDKTAKEAYECGFEDGYEKAMEEIEEEEDYGHRSNYRSSYRMNERRGRGMGGR